jgi:NAD(P)-dependent dehydrogenase (short-subunit alcohol dehydrogenase family)
MDLGLNGRVALVTGAARDVGREIALTLAAEGAVVAVNYRSSAADAHAVVAEIAAKGGKAKAYQAFRRRAGDGRRDREGLRRPEYSHQ